MHSAYKAAQKRRAACHLPCCASSKVGVRPRAPLRERERGETAGGAVRNGPFPLLSREEGP